MQLCWIIVTVYRMRIWETTLMETEIFVGKISSRSACPRKEQIFYPTEITRYMILDCMSEYNFRKKK